MLPAITPHILKVPDTGTIPGSPQKLPWPAGSLVSARLENVAGANAATLAIAGYRLRAEVPPGTPIGQVWLQLINQEVPSQFQLLTASQALQLLAIKLRQRTADGQRESISEEGDEQERDSQEGQQDLHIHREQDGRTLLLCRGGQDDLCGMVQYLADGSQFRLFGRLDLPHLGGSCFVLSKNEGEETVSLRLYVENDDKRQKIHAVFSSWVDSYMKNSPLNARLLVGIPAQFGLKPSGLHI
ncbi:MAG: hypothetical protein R8M38_05840 [Mariprofundaceae bacterium]